MTTISHKNLTGTQLHENKGAAAATDNTVATITSGATVWQKLTASHLTTTGNPFGGQLLQIQNQQTSGTNGASQTSGAFRTRVLNTVVTNEITSASLASNQISLLAGTYWLDALLAGKSTNNNVNTQARLRNITASTTLVNSLTGQFALESDGTSFFNRSNIFLPLRGRFTLAGTSTLELQQNSTANWTEGLASSLGTEIYADVLIFKVL